MLTDIGDGYLIVIADATRREVTACCPHGQISVVDTLPSTWTEAQHEDYAVVLQQLRTSCDCFDVPPESPETVPPSISVSVAEGDFDVVGFAADSDDPALECVRPTLIPGLAVSLAAERVDGKAKPTDDHDLATDRRLVQWFRRQRDQGAP